MIHILKGGRALCHQINSDFAGAPATWPSGHRWVSYDDLDPANADDSCPLCILAWADPVDEYYRTLTEGERYAAIRGQLPPPGELLGWVRRYEATVRTFEMDFRRWKDIAVKIMTRPLCELSVEEFQELCKHMRAEVESDGR